LSYARSGEKRNGRAAKPPKEGEKALLALLARAAVLYRKKEGERFQSQTKEGKGPVLVFDFVGGRKKKKRAFLSPSGWGKPVRNKTLNLRKKRGRGEFVLLSRVRERGRCPPYKHE